MKRVLFALPLVALTALQAHADQWVFAQQYDAQSVNDTYMAIVDWDRIGGQIAPVQITQRWAVPAMLTDGRYAMPVIPDITMRDGTVVHFDLPSGATLLPDSAVQALMPASIGIGP